MSSVVPLKAKKRLLLIAGGVALAILAVAAIVLRGSHPAEVLHRLKGDVDQGIDALRGMGPWVFFTAMALLPAVGAPMMAFTIPAGEIFAPTMTMPGVIAAALTAIAINLCLSYYIARYALRPILSKLIARFGYTVPRVTGSNALTAIMVLRLTPGPPFFLQCYLLGLAEAPFKLYLIASWICMLPMTIGAIVLGKGLLSGNAKTALTGLGVVVVAVVLINWVRAKYVARAK